MPEELDYRVHTGRGALLLGYVVYELCEKIAELREEGTRPPEEEIWMTSFWAITVNRVINLRQ